MLQIALDGIRRNPGQALQTAANHFLNNEIDNVLLLPLRSDLLNLSEVWQPTRAFWQDWNGQPSSGQAVLLVAYLGLLGLGLGTCWRKAGWAGLLPLGINLGYNLWTGLFQSSGERFLVPADWTATIYFGAGLVTLSGGMLLLLSRTRQGMLDYLGSPALDGKFGPDHGDDVIELQNRPEPERKGWSGHWINSLKRTNRPSPTWVKGIMTGLIIFALGSSLPLSEHLMPQRYPPASRETILAHLSASDTLRQTQALAQEPGALVLRGRAIYPRYYAVGEGEPQSAKTGYTAMPQARLVFFLLGQTNSLVVFDLPESPAFFPNTADVTLIGLPRKGYIQAEAVLVETPQKSALYLGPKGN